MHTCIVQIISKPDGVETDNKWIIYVDSEFAMFILVVIFMRIKS